MGQQKDRREKERRPKEKSTEAQPDSNKRRQSDRHKKEVENTIPLLWITQIKTNRAKVEDSYTGQGDKIA